MLNSTASRLAGFAAGLAVLGAAAGGVGAAAQATPPLQDCLKVAAADAGFGTEMGMRPEPVMVEAIPGADGLRSQLAGVTLRPISRRFSAGTSATWRFRITDCHGDAVRDFEPENGKLLHLFVVRRDFTGYQHLHTRPDQLLSYVLVQGDERVALEFAPMVQGTEHAAGPGEAVAPGQGLLRLDPMSQYIQMELAVAEPEPGDADGQQDDEDGRPADGA